MDNYQYDIVVPVGPNDIEYITLQIEYTKKNIIGYRNIYLVSYDPSLQVDGCVTINEDIYPFSKKDIEHYLGKESRQNWYIQQLLKLYSVFIIPGILDRFLVIDSDIFFMKPTTFIDNNEVYFYNTTDEYHIPYFEHMKRLLPRLNRVYEQHSGISHHMIFDKKYIKSLFDEVEEYHKVPFWIAFLKCITEYNTSGASEYEIYFNYMLLTYPEKIRIRNLSIVNIRQINQILLPYNSDIICYHNHSR
jgi:hypothetical protein